MSLSLAELARGTLENHESEMGEQYADLLMSLSSTYNCLGEAVEGLKYAQAHFKQRIHVEDSKALAERDDQSRVMAYTELALGWLLNNNYEEAKSQAIKGRQILEGTKEFINDTCWSHWADYHHAWALIGLDRAEEARPIVLELLKWRQRHYGDDDTESMKFVTLLNSPCFSHKLCKLLTLY
jgi:plasmid replication initiation protein